MGSVVLIPAALSVWFCLRRSPVDALLSVYLTAVLFCPDWARWVLPRLPDPTRDEAAILPLIALVLLRYRPRWKFSFLDFLIFPLPLIMGISEYVNAGYADAQNLLFDMLASSIFPYMMAKLLINSQALQVRFAKHLVLCLSLLFFTSLYEFKFAVNPFHTLFSRFFPGQGDGWVTIFRKGFPRVAGPFSHAILNGVVLMIGLQFAIWLKDSRLWERRKSNLSAQIESFCRCAAGSVAHYLHARAANRSRSFLLPALAGRRPECKTPCSHPRRCHFADRHSGGGLVSVG